MTGRTKRVVDLGFAVARVEREEYLTGVFTTLTLICPANSEGGHYEPAQSASSYMNAKQTRALIEALTETHEVTK